MDNHQKIATSHFQSYHDYFWKWDIDHSFNLSVIENPSDFSGGTNVVVLSDGITIAYKEQILELYRAFAEKHFPPFGSVLLAFLATNPYTTDILTPLVEKEQNKWVGIKVDEHEHKQVFEDALAFLNSIKYVPSSLKTGTNKINLLFTLLENAHNSLSINYAEAILKTLENKNFELNDCENLKPFSLGIQMREFRTLALLHKEFPNAQCIINKVREIPNLPEEELIEEDEEVVVEEETSFIEQLINEPKTFFIGSLIYRIQAGMNLPMNFNLPGEQTLGGVSDVTNKGDFNRLLISEFANDDEVFLHRIANHEALYIRRETPPIEDNRIRLLLIDTTIKHWGIPKILSFATALAIQNHPKSNIQCKHFMIDNNYTEVELDTVEKVIEASYHLSSDLNAFKGLELFLENLPEEDVEVIFLTSEKTLKHSESKHELAEHLNKIDYLITTNTSGIIDFFRIKNRRKKKIKTLNLPLEELWEKQPKKRKKREEQNHEDKHELPMLYGLTQRHLSRFVHEDYLYYLHKNGELYRAKYFLDSKYHDYYEIIKGLEFVSRFNELIGVDSKTKYTFLNGKLIVLRFVEDSKVEIKYGSKNSTIYFDTKFDFRNRIELIEFESKAYIKLNPTYPEKNSTYWQIDLENMEIVKIERIDYKRPSHHQISMRRNNRDLFRNIVEVGILQNGNIFFESKNSEYGLSLENEKLRYEYFDDDNYKDYKFSSRKKNRNSFDDGSKIISDKMGILTFKSSNEEIPTFYMSSFLNSDLAFASEEHFAGNRYFLPENSHQEIIQVSEFYNQYMLPFINHILEFKDETDD